MSFYGSFLAARMRKMYPEGEITFTRAPYGNFYEVYLTIPERDLMGQTQGHIVRELDRKVFHDVPRRRPHWSIRGRHAGK